MSPTRVLTVSGQCISFTYSQLKYLAHGVNSGLGMDAGSATSAVSLRSLGAPRGSQRLRRLYVRWRLLREFYRRNENIVPTRHARLTIVDLSTINGLGVQRIALMFDLLD